MGHVGEFYCTLSGKKGRMECLFPRDALHSLLRGESHLAEAATTEVFFPLDETAKFLTHLFQTKFLPLGSRRDAMQYLGVAEELNP